MLVFFYEKLLNQSTHNCIENVQVKILKSEQYVFILKEYDLLFCLLKLFFDLHLFSNQQFILIHNFTYLCHFFCEF